MKIKSLFLLVALVLPMVPAMVQAQGAPAMPLVVCHVDQAPQMLVPAYLCQWYGGQQHHRYCPQGEDPSSWLVSVPRRYTSPPIASSCQPLPASNPMQPSVSPPLNPTWHRYPYP